MIAFLQSLPVGNAVRCLLTPATGATRTRVLRKTTDDIADASDPDAAIVHDSDDTHFVDSTTLLNGTPYYYRAFDLVDGVWVASESETVTPSATAVFEGPDFQTLVRERLRAGLAVEVGAQRLQHPDGKIRVLTAPPQFDGTVWPVFSVMYRDGAPEVRGIGELVANDLFDPDTEHWIDTEGWLKRESIHVVGFTLNSDERISLRRALEKIVLGNMPVLEAAGMTQLSVQFNDHDEMEAFSSPLYSTLATISGLAVGAVTAPIAPISDVTVEAIAA